MLGQIWWILWHKPRDSDNVLGWVRTERHQNKVVMTCRFNKYDVIERNWVSCKISWTINKLLRTVGELALTTDNLLLWHYMELVFESSAIITLLLCLLKARAVDTLFIQLRVISLQQHSILLSMVIWEKETCKCITYIINTHVQVMHVNTLFSIIKNITV